MTDNALSEDPTPGSTHAGASYADAGVDIAAGERAVELFKEHVKKATRSEVIGGIGGFAGLFALKGGYREPVLASSTDGVGTKIAVAQAMDKHDTVGIDLVAMVVDDLVVCGAEPLFLQDYIAIGKVIPERVAEIVGGIADGCALAGCALLGGETAEHPGLMADGAYDISATGVDMITSLSSSATAFGNVGPGLGALDHANDFLSIPAWGRAVAMLQMLLGRLEIYPVILAMSVITLRIPRAFHRRRRAD